MKIKMPWVEANRIADEVINFLDPYVDRIQKAGSIRRGRPEIGDVEIVVIPKWDIERDMFNLELDRELSMNAYIHQLGEVVMNGDKMKKIILNQGIQLDLFLTTPEQWGFIFLQRTGSGDFNRWFVKKRIYGGALPAYLQFEGGFLWRGEEKLPISREEDVFAAVGVKWIEPGFRDIEFRDKWEVISG